jgi:23S rRNA (uracil1939-C5)-methyltransferase
MNTIIKPHKSDIRHCPHFSRCGGCQSLDKEYHNQLLGKKKMVQELFAFAGLPSIPAILPSPQIYYYRHKVQLPFGMKGQGRNGHVTLGCYAKDTHDVVDQHECVVQDKELSVIAWSLREWAQKTGMTVYNEKTKSGFLRHALLRKGAGTGEILICLVTHGGRPPGTRNLAAGILDAANQALRGSPPTIVGIVQNVNSRQTNVVLGEQEFTWWGRPFLFEKLGQYRFKVGISTFFQVNPFQTPHLYDELLKWVQGGPMVLDVYCGVGSITLWVSKKSRIVMGIEENGASIAAAKKAAQVNSVRNVRFVNGDAEEQLRAMANEGFELAIFDPPRKGLESAMLQTLLNTSLKRIIYVSCNAETLARDVMALVPRWKLISLQGVDMFPHTEHLEVVAVLDKQ